LRCPAAEESWLALGCADSPSNAARPDILKPFAMTHHVPIEINVREEAGIYFFEVHGRLTIGDSADQLTAALQSVLDSGARKVIVNLDGVPQIDSSGISSLVRVSVALGRVSGQLRLVCGPGRVRDALTVTRLIEAIPTFDSLPSALANFS
jgi:anti-anti-sigma factor